MKASEFARDLNSTKQQPVNPFAHQQACSELKRSVQQADVLRTNAAVDDGIDEG